MKAQRKFPFNRVLVFGAARSGVGAMHLLRHYNVEVVLVDEKPAMEFRSLIRRLRRLYVTSHFGKPIKCEEVIKGCQAIVVSPGIPLTHDLIQLAQRRGLTVLSEVELSYYFAQAPIMAITGTNGKTTVTTLAGQIVADAGHNAVVSGNIGRAFSDGVLSTTFEQRQDSVLVTEVSSFQLDTIASFRPNVAALLNISHDHLDRYKTMENYIKSKYRITMNQTAEDVLVLNQDDPLVMRLAEQTKAKVRTFSRRGPVEAGAYAQDGRIYLVENGETRHFCNVEDVPIPGDHNIENTLAALVLTRAQGIPDASILRTLRKFKGVEHRIEYVGKRKDGVRYYNDSKATNLESLEMALRAFKADEPIVLVAGGRDKNSNYERLNSLITEKVKGLVLIGEATPLIEAAWGSLVPTKRAKTMQEAVKLASAMAKGPSDVVLLSPACSSFDMYKDYEDRGRHFKRDVRDYLEGQEG